MLTNLKQKNPPLAARLTDAHVIRLSARMNQADELLADITKEFNKRLDDLEQFRVRIAPLLKLINDDGTVQAPDKAPSDIAALYALLWEIGEDPSAVSLPAKPLSATEAGLYMQGYSDGLRAAIKLLEEGGTNGTTGAGDDGGNAPA